MERPTLRLFDGYPHTSPALRESVRELQELLRQRDYPVETDGLFGTATERAIKQFQRLHGLTIDGIVGHQTWSALLGDTVSANSPVRFDTTFILEDPSLNAQRIEIQHYAEAIRKSAEAASVPPCLVCGIGSRESAWGLALTPQGPGGTGDFIRRPTPTPFRPDAMPPDGGGFGRGLMQIDYDAHAMARTEIWKDPKQNIRYACGILRDAQNLLKRKTGREGTELLRLATAAYNCGTGRVLQALRSNRDADFFTWGRNYARDVFNRAGWFQCHGWK